MLTPLPAFEATRPKNCCQCGLCQFVKVGEMSGRKIRRRKSFSVPMKDVMAAVCSGIGKIRKARKKGKRFGDDPYDDHSSDSDYSDGEIKPKRRKILSDETTKKSPKIKLSPQKIKSNDKPSEKRKRLVVNSSSDEENESCNEATTSARKSATKKRRVYVRKNEKTLHPIAKPRSKNVHFEDSDDDSSVDRAFGSSNVERKPIKSLKRPSLKRFRRTSSSSDIENLYVNSQKDVKKKSPVVENYELEPYTGENVWGNEIPAEILSKIFRFALRSENGAVPFLLRVRRVCCHWRNVAEDPALWTDLDLDFKKIADPKFALQHLTNFVSLTKSLSMARWAKLKNDDLDTLLVNNSKCIDDLDVSFCQMLLPKILLEETLPKFCPRLQSLNLSYFCTVKTSLATPLFKYLNEYGSNLRRLYLCGNTVNRFHQFCEKSCMENLQHLDISRLVCETQTKTNFLHFIKAFPNLTHLRISDAVINFTSPNNSEELENMGEIWPNLIEVEFVVSSSEFWGFINLFQWLMKCLKKCSNLRSLNIAGHNLTNLDLLTDIPLTHLNISRSSEIPPTLLRTMQKWAKSLEVLDVSWIKVGRYGILPEISPTDHPLLPLRRLNVSGTLITIERLMTIIEACPNLEYLDCNACRLLPLGMKQEYVGQEIRSLGRKLRSSL